MSDIVTIETNPVQTKKTKGILRDTETGLRHLAALVFAATAGSALAALYWPHIAGYITLSISALALAETVLWLLKKLFLKILDRGLGGASALALLFASAAYAVKQGAGEGYSWRVCLFAGVCTLILAFTAAFWWSLTVRRIVRPATVIGSLLCTALSATLVLLLSFSGFDGSYIRPFLDQAPERTSDSVPDLCSDGPYDVLTLDYGPGEQLDPGTVNLSGYMGRDKHSLTGLYVDIYMDYSLNEVPLRGRVWYPAELQNCPVLFIAHGNHEVTTPSYLGYGYLASFLASHGYAVVSVDENACNMLKNENDGRAVLLLEHISKVLEFSQDNSNPLFGVLDASNIAIAGHSRGGEMVSTAYLFNSLDCYPENGSVKFSYHFPIKALIAIAPTVDQYRPAGHSVKIQNVNYLLLHGAADRDVSDFMGMEQYHNVSFSGEGSYLKSALYIAGANHGQFNSLWGAYDHTGPGALLLNRANLLDQKSQQDIAKIFICAFLDATLRGDDPRSGLLTNYEQFSSQLPETVYAQCWAKNGFTPFATFEEDVELSSATLPGASISVEGSNRWAEERLNFGGKDGGHALRLRWSGSAALNLALPGTDLSGRTLAFDICDRDTAKADRGQHPLLDGDVVLIDHQGNSAVAKIGSFTTVYPVQPVRTDKLDFLFHTCSYKYAFSTVSIPIDSFIPEGNHFDPSAISEIIFRFTGGGQVNMDNIGVY